MAILGRRLMGVMRLRNSCAAVALFSTIAVIGSPVFAQAAPQATANTEAVESEIIVTGSFIR
ncbi:hypothetical protein, partial [Sandarakinorhabdus limnophila]|uniref:hypothetical protein n=1 Tax=Sandarakinorhabdus limnophila TaxID=210512 RepID=UPI0026F06FDB